jgi:plastocyanin
MKLLHTFTKLHIALIFVAALIGFGAVYALSSNRNVLRASQASCTDTCVALTANGADPSSVAVTRGSYVQFNSADGKSHNLSIGGGGDEHEHSGTFYSGEFQADEAWRVQFNDEGTFKFHDHMNPKINIVVVVYTPGKDYRVE